MSLDVPTPEPPALEPELDPNEYDDATVEGDDYRREELDTFLREGAWEEAFTKWAATTSVTAEEWAVVMDLGLLARFDFFWNFN